MLVVISLGCWIVQGLAMIVDEFYFHHRRGLGKWESIGHPIDSFFFLLCFVFCLFTPFSFANSYYLLALGTISTLIITKDEWIHSKQSSAPENWLHSILFVIHPLSLIALFYMWMTGKQQFIQIQTAIISTFMIYQIVYWNIIRKDKYAIGHQQ